ncbi:Asp-tRNA(Asn)/Glu-tRNA(Gln) amidotransferase subunit GatB [Candidatus Fokinia crypta]|uniref:Aspartyl/glutamyl-tRNA(Asn/Gln) amidotransferase subunit B n=1 Tax=Candidatus Fokinia crypta TaxID=1920990 RepID=A0ABZ0URX5_9RICK|nr:Asp-tRNA(Asn)/Glu-tRNA(Gln) amidotransferase subunit GatB [Candidatus Fokinia cryptica]WPX98011.1 Aspartyl/glutamyl-tRNA(Asn/Gln) amidotransferase subunit B [Candidatus Fokinia cryptica]
MKRRIFVKMIEAKYIDWELVIGLEVHAQLVSKWKLFSNSISASESNTNAVPNSNTSLHDIALPGVLPIPNFSCIEQAIKAGLALEGKISAVSSWDRKHYFYPDLPQGYQITQSTQIVTEGRIPIIVDGIKKFIGMNELHIEQDAAKCVHGDGITYVDFNRCGTALIEIVTKPDIRSKKEAVECFKNLRAILICIGVCNGNMENGDMRCDVNISVRKKGDEKYGTRVEIKNLNSTKSIVDAIDYEYKRQIDIIQNGGVILNETMLFNGVTIPIRSKEDVADYRYIKDPDLMPIYIGEEVVKNIKESIPELPMEKLMRYVTQLGIKEAEASIIASEPLIAKYFDEAVLGYVSTPQNVANIVTCELFRIIEKYKISPQELGLAPKMLSDLCVMIEKGAISFSAAKSIVNEICDVNSPYYRKEPSYVVDVMDLNQISDEEELIQMVSEVLKEEQNEVERYRNGEEKLLGYFVGKIMKKSKGKGNPVKINELLLKKLKEGDI